MTNSESKIRIKIVSDIAAMTVDAIVNAANSGLKQGGGVCGAIFEAAGSRQLQAACDQIGRCATGSAVVTPAFRLNSKIIIHAVGPRWFDGQHGEAQALYNCYQKSLELACENDCSTIAFPLISSGIFGYPREEAWEIALNSILDFFQKYPEKILRVYFAVRSQDVYEEGRAILRNVKSQREENAPAPAPQHALIRTGDHLPLMDELRKNIYEIFMTLDQAASPDAVDRAMDEMHLSVRNYHDFDPETLIKKEPDQLTLEEALICMTHNRRSEYYSCHSSMTDPIEFRIIRMALKNQICRLLYKELAPEFQTYVEHLHEKAENTDKFGLARILDDDGSVVSESEISLENLNNGHGMMSRLTLTDGCTMDGFLDLSRIYEEHPIGRAIMVWYYYQNPDNEYDTYTEICLIPYRDIVSVDSVRYTHPRWGSYVRHYPLDPKYRHNRI